MKPLLALGPILMTGACATMPRSASLLPTEVAAVCEVVTAFAPTGMEISGGGVDGTDVTALDAMTAGWTFKDLPKTIQCGGRRHRLSPRGGGYGEFIDSFALAADGQRLALVGGYQAAPLAGGGGYCVYERGASGWREIGCVHTWDS